ncbi:unnamed protein product [Rodentolepis nana]|uniref:MATH domain-containing protein n=1 Tax=Rodentolepis nana TaxID=102285 RepID=A0A0R3T8G0_RODNA|nr:unnamed protein product [Rodentolepis nana]
MSKDSILFESPAEVNAAIIQNGEMLLVELKFPGLRKTKVSQPESIKDRRSFFSCFNSSRDSQLCKNCEWFKFIGDRRHSGDWITVPTERKPDNCDLWLQIFRYRISVMLSPQDSKNATNSNPRVTQYFFWNSGCMKKVLNFRKSEMLIKDDLIALRLACGKGLWAKEDVEEIQKSCRGDKSENMVVSENKKFPEVSMVCDETGSVSTSESAKDEKTITMNFNNPKSEISRPLDDITEESLSQDANLATEEKTGPDRRITDAVSKKPEKEESKRTKLVERATSCSDMYIAADASVATADQKQTKEKPKPCHYCLGVQELLGKDEFSVLQARVESLNKDDWSRVLDIIMGKSNAVIPKPPIIDNQDDMKHEDLVNDNAPLGTGIPLRPQRRAPLRNARYLVLNGNLKK